MAQLSRTSKGQLTKYVGPIIGQIEMSMVNGEPMIWNGQRVVIKKSTDNERALEQFRRLASNTGTEKEAYEVVLQTNTNKTVRMGSFDKPKTGVGNRGDIAEGIIGAAIAARFINKNKAITPQLLKDVLRRMSPKKSPNGKGLICELTLDSENANPKVKDTVYFYLSLAKINMEGLLDQKNWSTLDDLFNSGVKYANGNTVKAWSKLLYENNQKNHIEVLSDGLGNQTGTKVDVSVKVDGEKTDINVSLKAGDVKQFGQVSGSEFEKQIALWSTLCSIDVYSLESKYNELVSQKKVPEAVYLTYTYAAKQINSMLRTPVNKKKFLDNLGNGIEYFATLREENVTLVQMNNNEAKVYNFKGVADAIAPLDLECIIKDSAGKPKMILQDKKKRPLLEVRVKAEGKPNGEVYIRNYVEKGSLMGDLIAMYA